MKRIALLLFLAAIIMTGCGKEKQPLSQPSVILESGDRIHIDAESIAILDKDKESIIKDINAYKNLKADDSLYMDIPKEAPVLEYVERFAEDQDFEEYYEQFEEMFKYAFPDRELKEEYLYYWGGSSEITYNEDGSMNPLKLVRDNLEVLKSGGEGPVGLIYDEDILGGRTEWDYPIDFEIGSQIGAGYFNMNKGKTEEIYGKMENGAYPMASVFEPKDYYECIASYPPDSEESYPLLDGECKIKDAVRFFEDYVNGMPYPKEEDANLGTKVVEVGVLKIRDGLYGYQLQVSKTYEGIVFDYIRNGTVTEGGSDYASCAGEAFMLESCDVDYMYSYFGVHFMDSVKEYKSIIPFDKALQITATSMTSDVVFDVISVELVYTATPHKDSNGYVKIDDGHPSDVDPYWKFALYNPNDNKTYRCYVSAVDGSFKYFKEVNQ